MTLKTQRVHLKICMCTSQQTQCWKSGCRCCTNWNVLLFSLLLLSVSVVVYLDHTSWWAWQEPCGVLQRWHVLFAQKLGTENGSVTKKSSWPSSQRYGFDTTAWLILPLVHWNPCIAILEQAACMMLVYSSWDSNFWQCFLLDLCVSWGGNLKLAVGCALRCLAKFMEMAVKLSFICPSFFPEKHAILSCCMVFYRADSGTASWCSMEYHCTSMYVLFTFANIWQHSVKLHLCPSQFLHRETCCQLMHGLLQGHYHLFLMLNGMPLCLLSFVFLMVLNSFLLFSIFFPFFIWFFLIWFF